MGALSFESLATGAPWSAVTACPCCGERAARVIATRDGKSGEPLLTVECSRCGLGRIDPLPSSEALAEWYAHDYRREYKGAVKPAMRHVLRAARSALHRWDWLNQQRVGLPWRDEARGKTSLDIGASSGEFVALMREIGMQAYGIEPNGGYAMHARQALQLEVLHGTIVQRLQEFSPGSLDLVTMFHVLEHLVDPVATLRLITQRLSPEGLLYIEVPNAVRPCSPHYMFFRAHVLYFTGASLRQTLAAAGLDVVVCSPDDADNLSIVGRKATQTQPLAIQHRSDLVRAQQQRRWIPYLWKQLLTGAPVAKLRRRSEEKRTAAQFEESSLLLKSLYGNHRAARKA